MDNVSALLGGFADVLTPMNLLFALLGVIVGTAVGVLPGIGPAMTVALLLPITYGLPVEQALILFAGIFYGGMYGGSTTSILLNTPGESASVVTALEGNKMAKTGRAAQALATSAIGSFIAGTIGTMLIVLVMPQVVSFAISLGSPEFLAIILVAFVGTAAILGSSRVRGFAALLIGITLGLVGTDFVTGQQRLTFGSPFLADDIDVVVIAVGIFAVGEALWVAAHLRRKAATVIPVGRPWLSKADWGRSWKPWLRGTALGFPFGAIPAGGAEIPTFLSLPDRAQALQAPRGVRQGRHRGRRRARGGQQRLGRGHDGAAAGARPADQRHRGDHARGADELRHRARAAAAHQGAGPGLDAHRQPVHRQLLPAGAQPAAGADLGQAAAHPAPLPLRRDPLLRLDGCVRRAGPAVRPVPAARRSACSGSRCGASACRCCR